MRMRPWVLLTAVTAGEMAGGCLRLAFPRWDLWESRFFLHGIGILGGDAGAVLTRILLFSALWLLLLLVLGLTVLAIPGTLLLLFLHGMTLGGELAVLYSGQVLTGLATALVFVMPYALVQTFLLLLGAREAWRAPSLRRKRTGRGAAGDASPRLYAVRFAVLLAALGVCSGMQGIWMGRVYPAILHEIAAK